MNLQPYLKLMHEQHASDMYFTTGAPVSVRIEGTMRPNFILRLQGLTNISKF